VVKLLKSILIIEDDKAIAAIERDYLTANGFEADIREDGNSGLESALNGGYDLILLDVMLPGVDGFEICRRLRRFLKIPVLMVTARKEDIDKIRGLGLGADDYIVKPFSPGELVARVKAHIAMFERLTETDSKDEERDIAIGSIRINRKTRRVYVKNAEVELKNKEYELLLFLIVNADMVFSKEMLYEHIWGMDAYGESATVPVHINRIREKIEEDPSSPRYIQTVWGAGYRFRA
jgi:DNA-binding response OmpR family regulator